MEDMEIREIPLFLREEKESLTTFLKANGLNIENNIDCAYGIYLKGALSGCGCAAGRLLKCFAITPELRGQNGLGLLVTKLSMNRYAQGIYDLFIITRSHNIPLFANCGFTPVANTAEIALLENRKNGVEKYLRTLPSPPDGCGEVGAIVMNGNPPTNGHLALIRHAAEHSGFLYLFVVEEDRSAFPFAARFALLKEIAKPFDNVAVCPSGPYMISEQTFPTYFLKETESPSLLQSELDVTLFAERIAPALKIKKRFVGQEPFDPVTRIYNDVMRTVLPRHGIAFCEIERFCREGVPICATDVRRLLSGAAEAPDQLREKLSALVPPCTMTYLMENYCKQREKNT